jgi:hypothetical protein
MIPLNMLGDPDYQTLRCSTDVQRNPALQAAFEALQVDPKKPDHWPRLLSWLALAFFSSSRGRGHPRTWDEWKLCQLLSDFAAIKRKHPHEREEDLCKRLKRDSQLKGRYQRIASETIQRKLQDARNPKYNEILKELLDQPSRLRPAEARKLALETISKREWESK